MDKEIIQESLQADAHEFGNNSASVEQRRLVNHAALHGNIDTVIDAVEKGYPSDTTNENGSTVLHFAAQGGHVNVIKEIVEKGCNINVLNNDGCSSLHMAAAYGRLYAVIMLLRLKAKSFLVTGNNGNISIQKTAYHTENIILARIRQDFDAGMVLYSGSTVVHCAAQGGSPAVIRELVNYEYDVNATADNGCSPLHIAAALGMMEVIVELVEKGANMSLNVPMFGTPLHQAALYGHLDVVVFFIEKGCDVNAIENNGYSVLHFAAEGGHRIVIEKLAYEKAEINIKSKSGSTPLHNAAYHGKKEAVFALIQLGAPKSFSSGECGTPLHQAALGGHLNVLTALIKDGCSVNALCSQGYSVLHSAASGGRIKVIRELVRQGFNLDSYASTSSVQEALSPLETSVITGQGYQLDNICEALGLKITAQPCASNSLLSLLFSNGLLNPDRILHLAAIPGDVQFFYQYFCGPKSTGQNICCDAFTVRTLRSIAGDLLPDFPLPDSSSLSPLHVSLFSANVIQAGKYTFHNDHKIVNHSQFINKLVGHSVLKGTVNMRLPTGHTPLDLAKLFGLNDIAGVLERAGGRPGLLNKIPPEFTTPHLTLLAVKYSSSYPPKVNLSRVNDSLDYYEHDGPFNEKPELEVLSKHVVPRVAAENLKFGIHLGIRDYIIDTIEKDYRLCEEVCLRMLQRWLNGGQGTGDKPRTWNTILTAVEDVKGLTVVCEIKEDIQQVSSLFCTLT